MNALLIRSSMFLFLLAFGSAQAMPILDIQGEQLVGAIGIDINGTSYDVQFVDGSCLSLFDGCNESINFAFQSSADAATASVELILQVFQDGLLGDFDTAPELTNGCTNESFCNVLTPYLVDGSTVIGIGTSNSSQLINDTITNLSLPFDLETGGIDNVTFAVWNLSQVLIVEEPDILWIMAFGFVAMGLVRRKHQH